MKKLFVILAVLVTMIAIFTLGASAEILAGDCGATENDNVTWTLDTETGVLTISGTGAMEDLYISPWDSYSSLIKTVVIENGVTNIKKGAFRFCNALTNVTIGNSVTSIGDSAFSDCSALTTITIPDSVVSIGNNVFSSCNSLANVTMFKGIKNIGDRAFQFCYALTSITIPDSVISIGDGVFDSCIILTSITVDANNTVYKSIDGNLYSKDGKTLIQYAVGKTETSFEIPESVMNVGIEAFHQATRLESISIPKSVTSIGKGAFIACRALINIIVDENNTVYKSVDGNLYSKDIKTLVRYAIGKTDTSFTMLDSTIVIGAYSFEGSQLKNIIIPNSVTSIEDYAFSNSRLKSITIPYGVTSIGDYTFSGCSRLASVTISDSVTSIGDSAFFLCTELTNVTIGNGVKTIGNSAFVSCWALTNLTIPNSVTSIEEYAFCDCRALESITIPKNVVTVGKFAFDTWYELTSIFFESPTTAIYDHADTISHTATIYGYTGSTAEDYATKYDRAFVSLDSIKFTGHGINLGSDITMVYSVSLPAANHDKDISVKFTMNGKEYTVNEYEVSGDQLTFKFDHIAPQCIGDTINADLYIDGAKVASAPEKSIESYCEQLLGLGADGLKYSVEKYKKLATLVADLLAYGAAAQDYVDYKVDSKPIIDGLTETEFSAITSSDTTISKSAVDGINFTSATLFFNNVNILRFKFQAADVTGITLKIDGVDKDFICIDGTNGIYQLETDDIYAMKFDKIYTVELLKDGEVIQTLTYSVRSYIYSMQSKTDVDGNPTEMAILAQRTWNYGLSAKAFQNHIDVSFGGEEDKFN